MPKAIIPCPECEKDVPGNAEWPCQFLGEDVLDGHTGATVIELTRHRAYFHKGDESRPGDIDTWFVPVQGSGTYRLIREGDDAVS